MMLKATANDRRHLALCQSEFHGPRSGLCRSETEELVKKWQSGTTFEIKFVVELCGSVEERCYYGPRASTLLYFRRLQIFYADTFQTTNKPTSYFQVHDVALRSCMVNRTPCLSFRVLVEGG
ncbi:hypothetical protein TNCV_3086271 [Trichonephila clavipes]|nr:hypothetical protein TNCV_3086271 [Trichonephila clavipes]